MADDDNELYELAEDPDEPAPKKSSAAGSGKGAASHFSGEDPEYVNPEIARIRREDQRRARAAEEAAEAAAKTKLRLIVAGVVALLLIVLWFLFLR